MYVVIGDAGNNEGLYKDMIDAPPGSQPAPLYCKNPEKHAHNIFPKSYQPQACFSYQDGHFCAQQQPEWSAYREPSFGFGTLEILSPTRAKWTWRKNQWPQWKLGDEVSITRGQPRQCGLSRVPAGLRAHSHHV